MNYELDFWKGLALSLKDDLYERGNKVAELRAQLEAAQQEAAKWYERLEDQYKIIEKVCEERDRLQAELVVVSGELISTDKADRYYRGFNDGYDTAKAQLEAGAWQPLPDGEYEMQGYSIKYILRVCNDGEELEAWVTGNEDDATELGVGEYRLCRRVQPPTRA